MLMSISGALNSFAACNVKDVDGKWTSAELGFVVEDEDGNTIGGNVSSQPGSSSSSQDTGAESYNDYAFKLGETYYIYLTVNGEKEVQYDDGSGSEYYCRLEIDTSVTGRNLKLKDPDTGDIAVLESDQIKGMNTDGEPCTISLDNIDPESDESVPFLYEVVELGYDIRVKKDGKDDRYTPTGRTTFLKGEEVEAFLLVNGNNRPKVGEEHYHKEELSTSETCSDSLTGIVLKYGDLEVKLDGDEAPQPQRSFMMGAFGATRSGSGASSTAFKYSVVEKINIEKVTFSGSNFTDVVKDDGTSYHADPQDPYHWFDKNLDGAVDELFPISYVKGAKTTLSLIVNCGEYDFSGGTINIKATGAANKDSVEQIKISATSATASKISDKKYLITMSGATSTAAFDKKVAYLKDMTIKWEIQFDKGKWVELGETKHNAYITLAKPICKSMYHTLFHIACKNADGKSNKGEVFKEIWKKLSSLVNTNVDEKEFYYYGKSATIPSNQTRTFPIKPGTDSIARMKEVTSTKGLLKNFDGKCGAWADFMVELLGVHDFTCTKESVEMDKSKTLSENYSPTDLIGWALPGSSGYEKCKKYSCFMLASSEGAHHGVPSKEFVFTDHQFVKYGDNYYDPSYGKEYGKSPVGSIAKSIEWYGWTAVKTVGYEDAGGGKFIPVYQRKILATEIGSFNGTIHNMKIKLK